MYHLIQLKGPKLKAAATYWNILFNGNSTVLIFSRIVYIMTIMILYNHHIIRIYHFRFFLTQKNLAMIFFPCFTKTVWRVSDRLPGVLSYAGDVAYSALLCRADLPYPAALVSAPDGPHGGGEPKSTEAPWIWNESWGGQNWERWKLLWCWHILSCFSLAATGWKGKLAEWPRFIPHRVWFLLTSFNVGSFQPMVCWWWFSTLEIWNLSHKKKVNEVAITVHQSDYRHLGGVIGFRPPKTNRLNIDN